MTAKRIAVLGILMTLVVRSSPRAATKRYGNLVIKIRPRQAAAAKHFKPRPMDELPLDVRKVVSFMKLWKAPDSERPRKVAVLNDDHLISVIATARSQKKILPLYFYIDRVLRHAIHSNQVASFRVGYRIVLGSIYRSEIGYQLPEPDLPRRYAIGNHYVFPVERKGETAYSTEVSSHYDSASNKGLIKTEFGNYDFWFSPSVYEQAIVP